MYTISEDLLTQNNIDFEILKPLILETARKIQQKSPKTVQTGPAKRNDQEVIKKHSKMLDSSPTHQKIYDMISQIIIDSE